MTASELSSASSEETGREIPNAVDEADTESVDVLHGGSDVIIPSDSSLPGAGAVLCRRAFALTGGAEDCGRCSHEDALIDRLNDLRESLPGDSVSVNMVATRRFFEDPGWVSDALLGALNRRHPELGITRILPSMRFIEYPSGGQIYPHTDGIMYDPLTERQSTTTFLLYLTTVQDGGTTDMLAGGKWGWGSNPDAERARYGAEECSDYETRVLHEVRPLKGALIVFPHHAPHEGTGVFDEEKIILRGDCL